MLYLANDVVQNARKKHPEIGREFGGVMAKVFLHLSGVELEGRVVERVARLVKVWKERTIFERAVQEEVGRIWREKGKEGETRRRRREEEQLQEEEEVPNKKGRLEEHEEQEEGDEEELMAALSCVRRLAGEQDAVRSRLEDGEQEELVVERCLALVQEEVQERRRLGEMLSDLVRRQQEELVQVTSLSRCLPNLLTASRPPRPNSTWPNSSLASSLCD